jgi:hypothetical protein
VKKAWTPLGEAVEPHGWRCRPGRGAQDQGSGNALCALPSYTSGIQEMDPPASSRPRKSQIFKFLQTYHSRHFTTLLRHNPVTSPSHHSSQLQCSTKQQHQQRPQIFVVLELKLKFHNPLFNKPIRRMAHVSNSIQSYNPTNKIQTRSVRPDLYKTTSVTVPAKI